MSRYLLKILWVALASSMVIGGIGLFNSSYFQITSLLIVLLLILSSVRSLLNKRFLLFVLLVGVAYLYDAILGLGGQISWIWYLLSCGLFWLLGKVVSREVTIFIAKKGTWLLVLGLVYGLVGYLVPRESFGDMIRTTRTLLYWSTENHHHLGDWMAFALIPILGYVGKRRVKLRLIIILSMVVMLFSMSRSAYLAFVVGLLYVFYLKRTRYINWVLGLVFVTTLIVGITKTTLYSRVFFIQAIRGVIVWPFGVGLGNFVKVSQLAQKDLTSVAHNLPLELMTGLGLVVGSMLVLWIVWGIVFVLVNNKNRLLVGSILVLVINFFFDYTYVVSTMMWAFFLLLGSAEKSKS